MTSIAAVCAVLQFMWFSPSPSNIHLTHPACGIALFFSLLLDFSLDPVLPRISGGIRGGRRLTRRSARCFVPRTRSAGSWGACRSWRPGAAWTTSSSSGPRPGNFQGRGREGLEGGVRGALPWVGGRGSGGRDKFPALPPRLHFAAHLFRSLCFEKG